MVTGSRTLFAEYLSTSVNMTLNDLHQKYTISELVCGDAAGIDQFAKKWALTNCVDVNLFKPDWKQYGNGAAFVCNKIRK